jgi:flagellar biosynthetic protein FliQ
MMSEAEFYDVLRQGLWVSIVISAPILTVALAVGLIIGLFQALTSVQEMTLTFVPKVAAMLAVFWVSMSFMTRSLTNFWSDGVIPMIAGG